MSGVVRHHRDLVVHQQAFALSNAIFETTKRFPSEERYSLTDQIRRSSRSVTTNIAEGWQKRRYEAAFAAKMLDAAGEAAETQDWLAHAHACGYLDQKRFAELDAQYAEVLRTLRAMAHHADSWCRSEQSQSTVHRARST